MFYSSTSLRIKVLFNLFTLLSFCLRLVVLKLFMLKNVIRPIRNMNLLLVFSLRSFIYITLRISLDNNFWKSIFVLALNSWKILYSFIFFNYHIYISSVEFLLCLFDHIVSKLDLIFKILNVYVLNFQSNVLSFFLLFKIKFFNFINTVLITKWKNVKLNFS